MPHRSPLREVKERIRSFVEVDCPIPSEDDLAELLGARGQAGLFLDYYDEGGIREGFARHGVDGRLAERGIPEYSLRLDLSDPHRHRLEVHARVGGREGMVGETVLQVGCFRTDAAFAPLLHGASLRMLFIHWLRLQDPFRAFCPERPALPGQHHPSLGVGPNVMRMYRTMAAKLGCDGIAVSPEFAHTASLYSVEYRFLDPEVEGTLRAIHRDVDPEGDFVAFAWAAHTGCLLDGGRPWRWVPGEQILPLGPALEAHFASAAWGAAVEEAAGRHRFALDRDALLARRPLREDGGPRVEEG